MIRNEKKLRGLFCTLLVVAAIFVFATHYSLLTTNYVHAQTFIGPSSPPPNGSTAALIVSSTRALGIGTSTVYSSLSSLIFKTVGGSNQHIIFLPNGNVGIGSSTPGYLLTVNGTVWGTSFIGALSGSLSAANVTGPSAFGTNLGTYNYAMPNALAVGTTTVTGLQANSLFVNGNVGIGTSSPARAFHLQGSNAIMRVDRSGSTPALQLHAFPAGDFTTPLKGYVILVAGIGANDGYFTINDYGQNVGGGSIERFKIANDGSVLMAYNGGSAGVGTTTPSYKLDVQGGQANASGGFCIAGSCISAWNQVQGVNYWQLSGNNLSPTSTAYSVGIGTAAPGYKLDIVGDVNVPGTNSYRVNTNSVVTQTVGGNVQTGFIGSGDYVDYGNTNHVLQLLTNGTPRVYVQAGGNVGIGTNSYGSVGGIAQNGLVVGDATANQRGVLIQGPSTAYKAFQTLDTTNGKAWQFSHRVAAENDNFLMDYWSGAAWTSVMALTSGGNVGVGQTLPGARLAVNNPTTGGKVGSATDGVYSYANGAGAALSAEQANGSGYGVYSSAEQNYFNGNIHAGKGGAWVGFAGYSTGGWGDVGANLASDNSNNMTYWQTNSASGINFAGNTITAWVAPAGTGGTAIPKTTAFSVDTAANLNVANDLAVAGSNIDLTNGTANRVTFGGVGAAVPGAASTGEKINLFGARTGMGTGDYVIGVEPSNMWFTTNGGYKWYYQAGAAPVLTLTSSTLTMAGQVKITGGSPGSGKVLTSDATGLATWTNPSIASNYWALSGNNLSPTSTAYLLGIGTSNPGEGIDSYAKAQITGGLLLYDAITNATNNKTGFRFTMDAGNLYIDTKTYAGGSVNFRTGEGAQSGAAVSWLAMDPTAGNVGFGVSPGSDRMTVGGNVYTTGVFESDNVVSANYVLGKLGVGGSSPGNSQLYVNGIVGIGVANPTVISAAAPLFAGVTPQMEVQTGAGAGTYQELVTIRHPASDATNVSRRLGLLLKMSNDNDANESSKMGGLVLESAVGWANSPSLYLVTANAKRMVIENGGNIGIGTSTAGGYGLYVQGTSFFNNQLTLGGTLNLGTNSISMNGGNIGSVGKLTVTAIDPLYDIGGTKYSTYAASLAGGVREEYVGKGTLTVNNKQQTTNDAEYEYTIDFNTLERGSDLWVWRSVVQFSKDSVDVFVTPYGTPVPIAYTITGNTIVFNGTGPAEFSYRLIGKRIDWKQWPTVAKDQTETPSLVVPTK